MEPKSKGFELPKIANLWRIYPNYWRNNQNWIEQRFKIFKKRDKTLPAIGLLTTGEGEAVTLEVATSFPGRCLGAIDHEDDLKR